MYSKLGSRKGISSKKASHDVIEGFDRLQRSLKESYHLKWCLFIKYAYLICVFMMRDSNRMEGF